MTLFQAASSHYDQRLHRAQHLARNYPFAAEILNFYSAVSQFQKSLYAHVAADRTAQITAEGTAPFREKFDVTIVLPQFRAFLHTVERNAPSPLADSARNLSAQPPSSWITLLSAYWQTACHNSADSPAIDTPADQSSAAFTQFFPRAFLQPYAEFLAEPIPKPILLDTAKLCPLCAGPPLLGVLRREGDGGKRFLLCSLCSQEWDFRRILCPTCDEQSELKLPVYVAEQFPHIRVEACDTCKSYIRTIDLTTDGNAIPLVDDLAALPLTLWAHEHGYTRRHANILGT